MYNYIFVFVAVIVITIGQLIFKYAAMQVRGADTLLTFLTVNAIPIALVATSLALYFFSTVAWVQALRTIPLSVAYPFNALAFIIIPLASSFIFNEALPQFFIIGAVLISAGIFALTIR